MNKGEFIELLSNAEIITSSQSKQLALLIEEYPYFQAARALHLKGLKQNHSFSYNAELRKTAAHTLDRSILFDYITSASFNQQSIAQEIKARQESATIQEEEFDEAIAMKPKEAKKVLDPSLFTSKEKNTDEKTVKEGEPFEFNKEEAHSFAEWLKLTKAKPIDREEQNLEEKPVEQERKFQLIDKFIAKNPKISPSKNDNSKEVSLSENQPSGKLMTETLARVYLEQKNYDKAIQAYKILILKNPEKSGFFADQIRSIEKIQENKNQ